MKYIITESQKTRLELLTFMTKEELASYLAELFPLRYPCDYNDVEHFLWAVRYEMENTMSTETILTLPKDMVWKEMLNMFGEQMIDHYYERCVHEYQDLDSIKKQYLGVK